MNSKKYIWFVIFVVISLSDGVKVNMQGSLSLGKKVMETLSYYLKNNFLSSRRSMTPFKDNNDPIYMIIRTTYLCRGVQFCERKLEKFVNEYITIQTKLIQGIFEGIMNADTKINPDSQKPLIFENELRACLAEIKTLLRDVSYKITDNNEAYSWIGIIKKISALFQERAISFVTQRLEGSPPDVAQAQKKLTQKIVIATTLVEGKHEAKLCIEHSICSKTFECTKSLNTLLQTFKDIDDGKIKEFIRFVYAALPETFFFSTLSEMTVNEFQLILNDMSYSDNVPTKKVLLSIQKTVQDRLDSISSQKHVIGGRDTELVYVILSDMDYFYSKNKASAFHTFLSQYFDWKRNGGRLGIHIRKLMKEMNQVLSEASPEIVKKLTNEVRVFMELTVDPET